MTEAKAAAERVPFEVSPPHGFQSWIGLIRAGKPQVVRRAILAAVIGWAPLAVLTAMRGDFLRPDHANVFSFDFAAHARFLIASPLLILAESLCAPPLVAIARQFVASGLVTDSERPRYDYAVASTRRLLNSKVAEVGAFVLAYAFVAALFLITPTAQVPLWHGALSGGTWTVSPAGWWGVLISLPLLLLLLLGWLWRLGLWARFLWLMSRMELRLIPSHPDHAAGLKFVGASLLAFMPLGSTVGVLAAGAVLSRVVNQGAAPLQFKYLVAAVAGFVVVLFSAPLLVFARRLVLEHHRGTREYGALALRMGEQLERKWLLGRRPFDEHALAAPDFSATTDLYSIASNVYAMSVVPLELRRVAALAVATLLPFIPVLLFAVPLDELVKKVAALFL